MKERSGLVVADLSLSLALCLSELEHQIHAGGGEGLKCCIGNVSDRE